MKFFQFKREHSTVPTLGIHHNGKDYDMSHIAADMKKWIEIRNNKTAELEQERVSLFKMKYCLSPDCASSLVPKSTHYRLISTLYSITVLTHKRANFLSNERHIL